MCYGRMKYRVRSLKFEGVGVLEGYRFLINKVSKDGSAKGNIEVASGQRVFGSTSDSERTVCVREAPTTSPS
jgi:hypothetical protein